MAGKGLLLLVYYRSRDLMISILLQHILSKFLSIGQLLRSPQFWAFRGWMIQSPTTLSEYPSSLHTTWHWTVSRDLPFSELPTPNDTSPQSLNGMVWRA
jgi:hypothetical protein